jgi:hypothetical protein
MMNIIRNVTLRSLVAVFQNLEQHTTYLFRVDGLPMQSGAQEIIPKYMVWHPENSNLVSHQREHLSLHMGI